MATTPVYRSSASNGTSSAGSITITKPTGVVSGDGMVAIIGYGATDAITPPSGWELLDSVIYNTTYRAATYFKVAGGAEPANYTWTTTGTFLGGAISAWSGTNGPNVHSGVATSSGPSHAATPITTTVDGCVLVYCLATNISTVADIVTPPTGYTERVESLANVVEIASKDQGGAGASGSVAGTTGGTATCAAFLVALKPPTTYFAEAGLQAVATVAETPTVVWRGQAALQAVATLTAEASQTPARDFTVYDAYVYDGTTNQGVIFYEDADNPSLGVYGRKAETSPSPVQAPAIDTGANPEEQRPGFGSMFAQGDFSHGAGQTYFHTTGHDDRMYFSSEGFDISEIGKLKHHHRTLKAESTYAGGVMTQASGKLFFANGQNVDVGDGTLPGTYMPESPHASDSAVTVQDLSARGDEVFAALGANGVHIRSAAGTWTHWQPGLLSSKGAWNASTAYILGDGVTLAGVSYTCIQPNTNQTPPNTTYWVPSDLNVGGDATRVAYLKNRMIVVGNAGRSIYEVIATPAPLAMLTLPAGWTFQSIFEGGDFIYATAVSPSAGLSTVYHFALNAAQSALEVKGSSPLLRNELCYAGISYGGVVLLGGGRWNPSGGYDPFLYRAIVTTTGALQLIKVMQAQGSGTADLSVLTFEPVGDQILFGWSLGTNSLTGVRTGLASYHIGRGAFSHHLAVANSTSPFRILDVMYYKGSVVFSVALDGLWYEDTTHFVTQAQLITSAADWNNAGLKVWDLIEIAHKSLPASARVEFSYSTAHPDQPVWVSALVSSTAGGVGASGRITNIKSRFFSGRLTSSASADATLAPEPISYSVRSNPTLSTPEFVITRYFQLVAEDRKDQYGEVVYNDPVTVRKWLQGLMNSWVMFYEEEQTWMAFVQSISDMEPAQPYQDETLGRSAKDVYVIRMDAIATRET